jgi:nicotinamidase-related amidase
MRVLLVIDMQVGLFKGEPPRYDADGVVMRINRIAATVRTTNGRVVFIQHEEPPGGLLVQGTEDWEILPALNRQKDDLLVPKQACDSFYETDLEDMLQELGVGELIITGCATEFCVDTTVRAAASRDYQVVVVADGHTTRDRPHLDAKTIIAHHNWTWKNLILPRKEVIVVDTSEVIENLLGKAAPEDAIL